MNEFRLSFAKYQACGNDFILIDTYLEDNTFSLPGGRLARNLCDRHFGVGGDGLLIIEESDKAEARMRIYDSQGPEADMCGNGIRCVAAYLMPKLSKDTLTIETNDGLKKISKTERGYRVDMGPLRFQMADLKEHFSASYSDSEELLEKTVCLPGIGKKTVSLVNSGVPHVVIFVDQLEGKEIQTYGEAVAVENDPFPGSVSVNLVQVEGDDSINIRTYEHGVFDETLACATGAAASAAVANMTDRVSGEGVLVKTKGGKIQIELHGKRVFMSGPATEVFTGTVGETALVDL